MSDLPVATPVKRAVEIAVPDLRVGDQIATRVDDNLRVSGKTVKVEELSYGRMGLYVFVNKRFRHDAGGRVFRVA